MRLAGNVVGVLVVLVIVVCLGGRAPAAQPEGLQPPFGKVYALLVGVEDYAWTGLPALSYTIDDAEGLAGVLRSRFGYETTVLTNPTGPEIEAAIEEVRTRLTPEDAFIFFFAGHGDSVPGNGIDEPQKIGYFIPRIEEDLTGLSLGEVRQEFVDAEPFVAPPRQEAVGDKPGQSDEEYADAVKRSKSDWESRLVGRERAERLYGAAIRMDTLRERLMGIRAKHVVAIFDACFAGLATRGGGMSRAEFESNEALVRHYTLLRSQSRLVLTAGTAGQEAIEHGAKTRGYSQLAENKPLPGEDGIKHGVFSYELITVLEEIPPEGLTLTSVREEVAQRVSSVMGHMGGGRTMTPQIRPFDDGQGEFVFVPSPEAEWLARAEAAIGVVIANMEGGGVGRGGLEALLNAEVNSERDRVQRDRLRSKAFVVLAYAASKERADEDLSDDPVWMERHRIALAQASGGDADAMAALYYMYRHGLGVAQSDQLAGHWAAEGASSDSSDAHEAWASAVREGVGLSGTAAEENHAQALERAEQQTRQQQTAAVAAAGAVMAMGADQEAAAGLMLAGAAIAMMASLEEQPEESIETSIAMIGSDVTALRDLLAELAHRGACDMAAFDRIKASVMQRQRAIVDQTRRTRQGAVGQDMLLELIGRSARELVNATDDLGKPLNRMRIEPAREVFAELELAYAKLVALMPYQMYHVPWN